MDILEPDEWRARAEAHRRRVDTWLGPHLERRRRGEKHPVEDFLFTYYSHRPNRLQQWHPGAFVELAGARDHGRDYVDTDRGVTVDVDGLVGRRRSSIEWTATLLARTASRPAQFGCFGLHEWAMVYRAPEVRHAAWPMRLPAAEIAGIVEERGVRCSHYDAFRFFTGPARPLNVLQPTRETQHELEQPGCLHATMDLYKWAYKLSPLVPSELVADCFELARDVRAVDMRASPYDLADLGYPPVRIETAEGRAEYAALQRDFTRRAEPLRGRLLAACEGLLAVPV
ncbi:3-methyladenine DNA glycosylase [Actinomadura harenae]|uniref:3-methyladenine DNA glycosylase n=1 Tax=Actinomadura harenae TaxID=2483351 RepID=A0A3M2LFX2_9ACTN|nr:3-methyladenine DNA glycosylase [Actinomadura harenae]RMI36334.1 3-methyladenine DNA glycosylase [Actinomadura harenae]